MGEIITVEMKSEGDDETQKYIDIDTKLATEATLALL